MTGLEVGRVGYPGPEPLTARERLRQAAHEFEGVFVAQLFREMRATIPGDEETGSEQELFVSMLDDTLAREMAGRTRGLGEALYRQLVARLDGSVQGHEGAARGE